MCADDAMVPGRPPYEIIIIIIVVVIVNGVTCMLEVLQDVYWRQTHIYTPP
jgi:hypothetical protein